MWVLGIYQLFSLSKTTNIAHGSFGESWRTDAKWIKEIALEQREYLLGNGVTERMKKE